MLNTHESKGATLMARPGLVPINDATVWFDLFDPTPEEEAWVEQALGIDAPTRAEMREIEASNRFYSENGAHYMTAFVIYNLDEARLASSAMTFILVGNRLVTVRYCNPKAFPIYLQRAERGGIACGTGGDVMMGILEILIARMADLIERTQDNVDKLAGGVFNLKTNRRDVGRRLDVMLKGTGKEGDVIARAQESATSLDRVLHFFANVAKQGGLDEGLRQHIEIAQKDITSLSDHMRFLSERIQFLLDATLGMITIEQNQIIKLFSVMAVMLMPPTLVASVYGMNFEHMPELAWPWGYPLALCLMVISGVIPFIYFKRKGWL
jgi:magnesium transporter